MTLQLNDPVLIRRRRVSRWLDRLASCGITLGGWAIVVAVVGILALIVSVSWPLFMPDRVESLHVWQDRGFTPVAASIDDSISTATVLSKEGAWVCLDLKTDTVVASPPASIVSEVSQVASAGPNAWAIVLKDGTISILSSKFNATFDSKGERSVSGKVRSQKSFPSVGPLSKLAAHVKGEEAVLVRILESGSVRLDVVAEVKSMFESEVKSLSSDLAVPPHPTALAVESEGREMALGWPDGTFKRFRFEEGMAHEIQGGKVDSGVSSLAYLLGGGTLVVGEDSGGISGWFEVNEPQGRTLKRVHELEPTQGPVKAMLSSPRTKAILAIDSSGDIGARHLTTHKTLFRWKATPDSFLSLSGRGDTAILAHPEGVEVKALQSDHPEVSLGTLFGKIWYEGFEGPSYTWQSSSGTHDTEPKLSLVPLVFGSLKGTFYAMLFALPLAVLSAVYISQFASDAVKKVVKPAVEIMSAIPSVVLGFIAALWLAPRLEVHLVALFLSLCLIPLFTLIGITLWSFFRRHKQLRQMERGWEWLWTVPYVLAGAGVAFGIAPWVESQLPGSDAREALHSVWGLLYDPRNCIVVAFGLGFTVTPLIFTLAEDALSNVPHSLRAASLALGATRWQTVWRVMLPSSSPGIFAGMIIGFGRAVGETMIVLMAAGNTPILDPSPFNGMRTLAANIAVEMPEAPQNGTLYRVLFLSAVILFMFTFSFNTLAEVVRQKLRKSYGRF
ncbi:MAG: ABC transporter permease subunit [Planctomycetota bacterium]